MRHLVQYARLREREWRVQVAGVEQADAPGVEAIEPPDPGGGRELGGHGVSSGDGPFSIGEIVAFVNY